LAGDFGGDAIDIVANVDAVGHGPFVRVVLHDIAVEEADGLGCGSSGEADKEGVEVIQNLPPEVVNRAVAFIDDNEVKGFDGEIRVVDNGQRFFGHACGRFEHRLLFVRFFEFLFAAEDGVEALDCSDADLAGRVERVAAEVLDDELFCEFVVGVRAGVLLEFVERLPAQIVAIDEEQNTFRFGELNEAVAERAGRERFAAAGGHLNETAGTVVGERAFEIRDGFCLHVPEASGFERRQRAEIGAELQLAKLGEPHELLRTVECEDFPAARLWIKAAGELGDFACRLVREWQRQMPVR
jgi:hypothetical protein